SDRAYRPTTSNTSTDFFKKNDSFLTKAENLRLCGLQILFSGLIAPCGQPIPPSLLHNRPI
ncbi:hypothetical protein, partial [Sinorhizobium sp. BJ1]|uniref:hypothetical protein n=1 Tax=Sinorhizobium sp. BJ1 TaxID=2035455 RepID=UPI001AEC8498